jgi:hypothetical protein
MARVSSMWVPANPVPRLSGMIAPVLFVPRTFGDVGEVGGKGFEEGDREGDDHPILTRSVEANRYEASAVVVDQVPCVDGAGALWRDYDFSHVRSPVASLPEATVAEGESGATALPGGQGE